MKAPKLHARVRNMWYATKQEQKQNRCVILAELSKEEKDASLVQVAAEEKQEKVCCEWY